MYKMDSRPVKSGKVKNKKKNTNKSLAPYTVNLCHRLIDREYNMDRFTTFRHINTKMRQEVEMFRCLPPNFTIQNIDKPLGFLRKFTPDGLTLYSVSDDQHFLNVYDYRGIGHMSELLKDQTSECITADDQLHQSLYIRQEAFNRMFALRRAVKTFYGIGGGYLNREFSIALDNGRYVVLASSGSARHYPNSRDPLNYPDTYQNCDAYFYNFYLVDMWLDYVCHHIEYKYDCIQLSHNNGVSSFGMKIAIFSRYRQCIDIYDIKDAEFRLQAIIGPCGAHVKTPSEHWQDSVTPHLKRPLTHFKQRLLTFLYREAIKEKNPEIRRKNLKDFYKNFPIYERLLINKVQMFDTNSFLIRYERHPEQTESSNSSHDESDNRFNFYVFYDYKTEKILQVYKGDSKELLMILRDYPDYLRCVRSIVTGRSPSSSGNNDLLLATFNDIVSALGPAAPERLNPTLPISSQSFTPSHYLDMNFYKFDETQISSLERPKIFASPTIEFHDRRSKLCAYRLHLQPDITPPCCGHNRESTHELVAFIFHPFDPFIISVQKFAQHYVVNFHVYNKYTIVKP